MLLLYRVLNSCNIRIPVHFLSKVSGELIIGVILLQGDRLVARYSGIMVISVLGVSVVLAFTILCIWALTGIDGSALYLLRKGWIVA